MEYGVSQLRQMGFSGKFKKQLYEEYVKGEEKAHQEHPFDVSLWSMEKFFSPPTSSILRSRLRAISKVSFSIALSAMERQRRGT